MGVDRSITPTAASASAATVAATTAAAASATVAATAAAATTTAIATATAAATSAAIATAAAAAATATAPGLTRLGLVHGQATTVVFLVVQALDCRLRLGLRVHFDKAKALAAAGVTVGDHLGALHGPVLGEPALEIGRIHGVSQVANIQFLSHE
jgi:hypothetical protein